MDIGPADLHDPATRDALFALSDNAARHDRPGFPPLCRRLFEYDMTVPSDEVERSVLWAHRDGRPVAAVFANRPMVEDRDAMECLVVVDPALRRNGIGRRLLAAGAELARAHGRSIMVCHVSAPLADDSGWSDSTGFVEALGWRPLLTNIQRRLDLAELDLDREDRLYAEALAASTDYELVHWVDAAPEEYIADLARLEGRIHLDVPHGDAEIEVKQVDSARMRRWERGRVDAGMTMLTVAARPRDGGRLAGYTQLRLMHQHHDVAGLPITLVDPDHRGHRLGLLLKIAARRRLSRDHPGIRAVVTSNADSNGPMLAINDRLGYRRIGRTVLYRHDLS